VTVAVLETEEETKGAEVVSERPKDLVTLADAMEGTERHVRAKVNFYACVRTEEFGEDIGMCIVKGKSPPWRKLRAWNVAVRSGIFAGMRSAG
jgi:hypothetical protein